MHEKMLKMLELNHLEIKAVRERLSDLLLAILSIDTDEVDE